MPVDKAFANALEDLTLEPLGIEGETLEDSLTAGYSMPEVGASDILPPLLCCSCYCC
jgi:hypothetical protein